MQDLKIIPFYGFGDDSTVLFRGRVIKDNRLESVSKRDGWLSNLISFYKRFSVKPIVNQYIKVVYKGSEIDSHTNQFGIFNVVLETQIPENNADCWQKAEAILLDKNKEPVGTRAILESLVDIQGNEYGIISDIDDTILIAKVSQKIKLAWLVIFGNARSRLPFPGTAEFYQRLIRGSDGQKTNPIFYVSSSHWNLYDFLVEFINRTGFPKGPFFLKRIRGWRDLFKKLNNHKYKEKSIRTILDTFQNLDFILIGDSSQHDAIIYEEIAKDYPGQIKVIYIRDVTKKRDPLVEKIILSLKGEVPVVVFKEAMEAADDARTRGLIN